MTDNEMRIAIAEACGWTQIRNANEMAPCGHWVGHPPTGAIIGNPQTLPHYQNDLNAMHEAEKQMDYVYWNTLYDVCNPIVAKYIAERNDHGWHGACNATASQRAEAFLRTIGKWKD